MESRSHKYLAYADEKISHAYANQIAAYVLNKAGGTNHSVSKLKKLRTFTFIWTDKKGRHSKSLGFDQIAEHLIKNRSISCEALGIPILQCEWLDSSIHIALPGQLGRDSTGKGLSLQLTLPFGDEFPIKPCIDRAGVAMSSFQTAIQTNIARLHRRLVETSDTALNLDGLWLNDLRFLLNECVSIFDITLHQLYFMAEYRGGERGWVFSAAKLGPRHGVRITDKIRWIYSITGKPLDDAKEELAAFKKLKALRNHLNHFDPPCFAYTLDEVAEWMNLVPIIGRLLWKVRSKLGSQLSVPLIDILFLREISYVSISGPHVARKSDVGYLSSIWSPVRDSSGSDDERVRN